MKACRNPKGLDTEGKVEGEERPGEELLEKS